jgi:ABC-type amino acid transport substrate-binding protein
MSMLKNKNLFLLISLIMVVVFISTGCAQTSKGSQIKTTADLAGMRVGVQVSTTADESVTELLKTINFTVTRYDQIIQPFSDLKTGRLDAIIVDEVVAKYYVAQDPKSYKIAGEKLTNEPIGILFKKGNEAMRDKVDDLIIEMRNDGTLKNISETWFDDDLVTNVDGMATTETGTGSFPADKKLLTIGVDDSYPPMEFKDDNNNTVGFDVDLAKEIGKRLGMEVQFISTAWDGIFTALNTDKFDCVISSISITDDRQQNFAITKPYIANAQVIVVKP